MRKTLFNTITLTIVGCFLLTGCAGHRQAKELSQALAESSDIAVSYARQVGKFDESQTEIFNRTVRSYSDLLTEGTAQIWASADAHARTEYQRAKLQVERNYWVALNDVGQSLRQARSSLSTSIGNAFAPLRAEIENFETKAIAAKSEADAHPGDQVLRAAYGRAAAEYLARFSQMTDDREEVRRLSEQRFLKLYDQSNLTLTNIKNDHIARLDAAFTTYDTEARQRSAVSVPDTTFVGLSISYKSIVDYLVTTQKAHQALSKYFTVNGFGKGSLFDDAVKNFLSGIANGALDPDSVETDFADVVDAGEDLAKELAGDAVAMFSAIPETANGALDSAKTEFISQVEDKVNDLVAGVLDDVK